MKFAKCMKINLKKVYVSVLAFLFFMQGVVFANPSGATQETPKIISGTVQLAQDLLFWLLVLLPFAAGGTLAYFAFMKGMSHDDAHIQKYKDRMKNVLTASVIAECASGLILLVLSYYQ